MISARGWPETQAELDSVGKAVAGDWSKLQWVEEQSHTFKKRKWAYERKICCREMRIRRSEVREKEASADGKRILKVIHNVDATQPLATLLQYAFLFVLDNSIF